MHMYKIVIYVVHLCLRRITVKAAHTSQSPLLLGILRARIRAAASVGTLVRDHIRALESHVWSFTAKS